jgi:hypothetical protein
VISVAILNGVKSKLTRFDLDRWMMLGKKRYFLIHRDANGLDFAFTIFFVRFRANRIMTKDSKMNISDHGFKIKVGRRPRIQNRSGEDSG